MKRIYNRIVFDELELKKIEAARSTTPTTSTSRWCSHPNWYWVWSKYTLPYVDHPAVPRARYVSDLDEVPAGSRALRAQAALLVRRLRREGRSDARRHRARSPQSERGDWLLQEKIVYEPALQMPDGNGVKAEVRMMFLRAPDEAAPTLVLNLVRLSRGKMLGVDQNRI